MRPSIIYSVLALLLTCTIATAQVTSNSDDIRVEAELSRSSVYVGDEIAYTVAVFGAINPARPNVEFPPGVKAVFHGRSSQSFTSMQYDENRRRRSVTQRSYIFQYTLTAQVEGELSIPAPEVKENGQTVTGNPTSFRSLLPTQSDVDDLTVTLERTRLYQNETIEVECVWWIGDNTSDFNFASSSIPDSFEIRALPAPQNTQQIEFPLNGQPITGSVSNGTHNGRQLSRFTFRFTITPTELGRFDLGPLRTIFTRQSGTGSRYRAYAESDTTIIEVIPVPSNGQPDNYDGAIGEFRLEARASNSRVNVGDPIELTLRIRGQEPMTGVQDAPDLESIPSFTERFKIDSEGWRESLPHRQGIREYSMTIRALSDSVDQIPSIELPSFDPELEAYRVYETAPIPLDVNAVREITLADAIVSGTQPTSTPERPSVERIELTAAAPGLWAHGTAEEIRESDGFNLAQTLQQPAWIATLSAPPALYVASLLFFGYRRRRNLDLLRVRQAYAQARRRRGVQGLRCYLAHTLGIDINAVVASDAMHLPVDDADRIAMRDCLIAAERPGAEQANTDQSTCETILRSVHQQCLSQARGGAA